MTEPLVCAILLTKDRPEMAKRAVECFRSQTYQNKALYIFDTGARPCLDAVPDGYPDFGIVYHRGLNEGLTIGELRNRANWWGVRPHAEEPPDADIIVHFDDDDVSHPNRISEQVALLQASGKQCVGYRDMLFWRDMGFPEHCPQCVYGEILRLADGSWTCRQGGCELTGWPGEAWLYSNADPRYIVGSSLCYWRETWEKRPFRAAPENPEARGEDVWFIMDRDTLGVSSIPIAIQSEPRMICSIHGRNTTSYAGIEKSGNWKRVPEFDEVCRRTMTL